MRTLDFTGMYSGREKNARFIKFETSLRAEDFRLFRALRESRETSWAFDFVFTLFGIFVLARDSYQLHVPLFLGIPKQFAMKIYLIGHSGTLLYLFFQIGKVV